MDPNSLSWIYGLMGLVSSAVGTGSAVRNSIQPYPTPPPIAASTPTVQIGQSCMLATRNDMLVAGTIGIIQHGDGSRTIECIPDMPANKVPRR